jgi:heat shock protein HslJ
MKNACFAFLFSLILLSCGSSASAGKRIPNAPFEGTRWTLVAINETEVPQGRNTPFITFKGSAGLIGNGGCNSFFGSYSKKGKFIQIPTPGSTEMYCDGPSELESQFLVALPQMTTVEIQGRSLRLSAKSPHHLILHFTAQHES